MKWDKWIYSLLDEVRMYVKMYVKTCENMHVLLLFFDTHHLHEWQTQFWMSFTWYASKMNIYRCQLIHLQTLVPHKKDPAIHTFSPFTPIKLSVTNVWTSMTNKRVWCTQNVTQTHDRIYLEGQVICVSIINFDVTFTSFIKIVPKRMTTKDMKITKALYLKLCQCQIRHCLV